MPWQCRMIDPPKKRGDAQPGDMWFADPVYYEGSNFISDYYRQHNSDRQLLFIRVPKLQHGTDFCVDSNASSGAGGWTVTGEAPNITVNPSINIVGFYHGWLQNGVLSDDVEGRTFGKG